MSIDRKKATARGGAILRAFTQACKIVATFFALVLFMGLVVSAFQASVALGLALSTVSSLGIMTYVLYENNKVIAELEEDEEEDDEEGFYEEDYEDDEEEGDDH